MLMLQEIRLNSSNSIFSRCHFAGATSRSASQSGNAVWIRSTSKPSLSATRPKANITPFSVVGALRNPGSLPVARTPDGPA